MGRILKIYGVFYMLYLSFFYLFLNYGKMGFFILFLFEILIYNVFYSLNLGKYFWDRNM